MPCAETDTLTADISKVLQLVKELPGKAKALFKHCEKIRNKVNIFFLPGVLDCLTDLLGKELRNCTETDARYILDNLVEQIRQNRDKPTQKPLVPPALRPMTRNAVKQKQSTKKMKLIVPERENREHFNLTSLEKSEKTIPEKQDTKLEIKPDQKQEIIRQDSRPDLRQDSRSDLRQDSRLELRQDFKPEIRQECRPELRQEVREVKPEVKPDPMKVSNLLS